MNSTPPSASSALPDGFLSGEIPTIVKRVTVIPVHISPPPFMSMSEAASNPTPAAPEPEEKKREPVPAAPARSEVSFQDVLPPTEDDPEEDVVPFGVKDVTPSAEAHAGEFTDVSAFEIAKKYAPGMLARFKVPTSKMDADDLTSGFMENFLSKGFAAKFNPTVRSYESYVHAGMKNYLISFLRRGVNDPNQPSLDEPIGHSDDGGEKLTRGSIISMDAPKDYESRLMIEEALSLVPATPFGYGIEPELELGGQKKKFKSNVRDLMYLLLVEQFTQSELAALFQVTQGRIYQLVTAASRALTAQLKTT